MTNDKMIYPDVLGCGHHIGYLMKVRDRNGEYFKYCMGCFFEKNDFTDIKGKPVKNHKEERKSNKKDSKKEEE